MAMYQQAADGIVQELLYESLAEFESELPKKTYYWVVWHYQGINGWQFKAKSTPEELTHYQAGMRHARCVINWSEKLVTLGGWLYVACFADGQKERCDMINLLDVNKKYPCT
jgi:hypothetical protein